MYCIYVLYSKSLDKFYVGQSDDLARRMSSHHAGISPFTSRAKDWELVYQESFSTRTEARKRENAIKRKKSRRYIEWLIENKQD